MAITDYNSSASLNLLLGSIPVAEGMDRELVNDALRQLMADIAGGVVANATGSGAVDRTPRDKSRDVITPADYGALSDGTTNDSTAFGNAITRASSVGGPLLLTGPVNVGTVRPDLKGVQILGTKPVTYDVALDYGKAVANRRGRDLGQSALGRSYLFRFWVYLSQFGDAGTANIKMYGDSVTESYVGPIVEDFLTTVSGVGTVTNNAISGTTIEQWRTGSGSYVASGKALSDWIASPSEMLYIAFGINTPFFGGSPSSFATSLENALITIRAAREVGETSIVVVLPIASRDGGAMSIEGGWKRDEYYVHALRELCEPFVDKYGICLFDPTVATPEADIDATGTNALNWLDATGVHPLFGNKYFVAGEIFDAICPTSMRSPVVAVDATANVTPSSGFTLPATEIMRGIKRRDIVVTDGYVDMTTPATLTNGQNIAVLPAALRPAKFIRRVDLVLFNGSTFETIRGEVNNSTGQISAGQASSSSPERVYLIGQWSAT